MQKVNENIQVHIDYAMSLDLTQEQRPSRNGEDFVVLHDRKQAGREEKLLVILTLVSWGYETSDLSNKEKKAMVKAACNQVSYDFGFKKIIGHTNVSKWVVDKDDYIAQGDFTKLVPKHCGTQKYTDKIEEGYKGYLVYLWRYAVDTITTNASFGEFTALMNEKSKCKNDPRPGLNLHKLQVYRWFKARRGKEVSTIEKPLDTPKHSTERRGWVYKNYPLLSKLTAPVAFLDEKFFYTTSRRKKSNATGWHHFHLNPKTPNPDRFEIK